MVVNSGPTESGIFDDEYIGISPPSCCHSEAVPRSGATFCCRAALIWLARSSRKPETCDGNDRLLDCVIARLFDFPSSLEAVGHGRPIL